MFSWWPWVLKESRRSSCHLWAVAGGPWGANTLPWWHLPSLGSCSKRNPRVPDGAKCSGCKASQGRRGGDQGRECLSRPEGGERAACTCRKSSRQRAQQGQKGPEVGARRYLRSSGGAGVMEAEQRRGNRRRREWGGRFAWPRGPSWSLRLSSWEGQQPLQGLEGRGHIVCLTLEKDLWLLC